MSLAVGENGKGRLAALHQRRQSVQHKRVIEYDTRLDYPLKLLDINKLLSFLCLQHYYVREKNIMLLCIIYSVPNL